jgi:hypothetical protein
MKLRLIAISALASFALAACVSASPARAEKVQIDPSFNTVQCPTCSGAAALGSLANASPAAATEGSTTTPLSLDLNRSLRVNCVTGCSGSGGTSTLANASPTTVTEGSSTTPLSLDLNRNLRVVFSNTSLAATQSGAWNITNISGTVSLPTGAATSANQSTEITSLSTLNTNFGAQADTAAAADTSTASLIALVKRTNQNLTTLNTTAGGAIPAGSAIIGNVRVDQTTPGSTNGVQDAATSATGSAVPAKAGYAGAVSSGNLTGLIQADASAAISVSTATTTQIVALSSTKKIYITSFDVIAGGTGNITFEYGTGSNCGTGTTVLTGAYNLTAQAGIAKGNGLGPVLVVPASNALCVLTSAAVQMSGSVAYTQF